MAIMKINGQEVGGAFTNAAEIDYNGNVDADTVKEAIDKVDADIEQATTQINKNSQDIETINSNLAQLNSEIDNKATTMYFDNFGSSGNEVVKTYTFADYKPANYLLFASHYSGGFYAAYIVCTNMKYALYPMFETSAYMSVRLTDKTLTMGAKWGSTWTITRL